MKPINEIRRENLARWLESANRSQTSVAKSMELPSPSIVNQHVRGTKNIGDKFARRYEEVLGLPQYSLDSEGTPIDTDRGTKKHLRAVPSGSALSPNTDYLFVPPLNVTGSIEGGWETEPIQWGAREFPLARMVADRMGIPDENAALVISQDGAMSPLVESRDFLIVDYKDRSVTSGKVYALVVGREILVRRLFNTPEGGLRIAADNIDKVRYPDWDVEPGKLGGITIIARVVGVIGAI